MDKTNYNKLADKFLGKEAKDEDIEIKDDEEKEEGKEVDISSELHEIENDLTDSKVKAKEEEEEEEKKLLKGMKEEEEDEKLLKGMKEEEEEEDEEKKEKTKEEAKKPKVNKKEIEIDDDTTAKKEEEIKGKVDKDLDLDEEEEKIVESIIGGSEASVAGVKPDVLAGNTPKTNGMTYGSGWAKVAEQKITNALNRLILEHRASKFWKKRYIDLKKEVEYNNIVNNGAYMFTESEVKKIKRLFNRCQSISDIDFVKTRVTSVIKEAYEKHKSSLLKEDEQAKQIKKFLND